MRPLVVAFLFGCAIGITLPILQSAAAQVPQGATARCKDGTYTTSEARQGACSGHGGVAEWLVPADANAKCKDGTYQSGPRQGACSGHGGVAEWLVPPTATARCEDGTYYLNANRQGACSGHGGVAEWLAAEAKPIMGAQGGATTDWERQLRADLVVVRAGEMTTDEYNLVKIAVPGYEAVQLQVKIHAEAPVGGLISRDNFVALTTQMVVLTFFAAYADVYQVPASQFIQAVDFTELTAPIGTPDVELNLYMTNEGLQFEWVNTADGKRSRWTSTWAEVYPK
jgi:hypothetical protein